MSTAFSLARLTAPHLPPEVVRVAARTGYRTVGLRLLRTTDTTPGSPSMDDPALMRATKAVMAGTGVGVLSTSSSCGSRRRSTSRAWSRSWRRAPSRVLGMCSRPPTTRTRRGWPIGSAPSPT